MIGQPLTATAIVKWIFSKLIGVIIKELWRLCSKWDM